MQMFIDISRMVEDLWPFPYFHSFHLGVASADEKYAFCNFFDLILSILRYIQNSIKCSTAFSIVLHSFPLRCLGQ